MSTGAVQILEKGLKIRLKVLVLPNMRKCIKRSAPHIVGFRNFPDGKDFWKTGLRLAIPDAFERNDLRMRRSITERIAEACRVSHENVTIDDSGSPGSPITATLPKKFLTSPKAEVASSKETGKPSNQPPNLNQSSNHPSNNTPETSGEASGEEQASPYPAHPLILTITDFKYPVSTDPKTKVYPGPQVSQYWQKQNGCFGYAEDLTDEQIRKTMTLLVYYSLNYAAQLDEEERLKLEGGGDGLFWWVFVLVEALTFW